MVNLAKMKIAGKGRNGPGFVNRKHIDLEDEKYLTKLMLDEKEIELSRAEQKSESTRAKLISGNAVIEKKNAIYKDYVPFFRLKAAEDIAILLSDLDIKHITPISGYEKVLNLLNSTFTDQVQKLTRLRSRSKELKHCIVETKKDLQLVKNIQNNVRVENTFPRRHRRRGKKNRRNQFSHESRCQFIRNAVNFTDRLKSVIESATSYLMSEISAREKILSEDASMQEEKEMYDLTSTNLKLWAEYTKLKSDFEKRIIETTNAVQVIEQNAEQLKIAEDVANRDVSARIRFAANHKINNIEEKHERPHKSLTQQILSHEMSLLMAHNGIEPDLEFSPNKLLQKLDKIQRNRALLRQFLSKDKLESELNIQQRSYEDNGKNATRECFGQLRNIVADKMSDTGLENERKTTEQENAMDHIMIEQCVNYFVETLIMNIKITLVRAGLEDDSPNSDATFKDMALWALEKMKLLRQKALEQGLDESIDYSLENILQARDETKEQSPVEKMVAGEATMANPMQYILEITQQDVNKMQKAMENMKLGKPKQKRRQHAEMAGNLHSGKIRNIEVHAKSSSKKMDEQLSYKKDKKATN
ncbi:hypothetical protein ACOME3_007249 [Neoechinorhynchus agilis]